MTHFHVPHKTELIADRYRLVRKIATGGFASVWEAGDTESERRVAVKFMLPNKVGDPMTVKRFIREARLVSQLKHENIVEVLDFGVTTPTEADGRGVPFLVMEYLEGLTIEALMVKEGGALRLKQIIDVYMPVLEALENAHKHGVIHRDLKPENVFIEDIEDGQTLAKVIDFGICKHLETSPFESDKDRLTKTDQVFGTPEYMAPEQIAADPLGPQADIYSLGIMLYEMLTGRQPYQGATAMKVMMQHLNDDLPPLPEPYTDHPIAAIVKRCTAKNPKHRYRSAAELKKVLERLPPEALDVVPPTAEQRREMALAETVDLERINATTGPLANKKKKKQPTAIAGRLNHFKETDELRAPPSTGLIIGVVAMFLLALAILIGLVAALS